MSNTEKLSPGSPEKAPLHRPAKVIDVGSSNDGDESPIVKPSREMHTTKPTPGNEAPGQTTKM
jgi:hypothetical protein